MPDPTKEQAYREEAERLALLPVEDRRAAIGWLRDIARTAPRKRDREEAEARADALERLLKLAPKKGKRPDINLDERRG
jgi:hypothetical protein